MSRPLTGYKKNRDGVWLASVPRRRGVAERVWGSFDSEAQADVWLGVQIDRLRAGLEAQGAAKKPRRQRQEVSSASTDPAAVAAEVSTSGPVALRTFEEYAMAWHHEYYDLLHRAGPERARDVESDLRLHIFPHFSGPIETDVVRGRKRVIDWTRKMAGYPSEPGDEIDEMAPTLSTENVSGMLWLISQVLLYAHTLGAPVVVIAGKRGVVKPALTKDVSAMKPRKRAKRRARLVAFVEARALASELHVVHQIVLWLMRVAGLRISESYGLRISNFVFDGEWGYLLIGAMGGRTFLTRDENEFVVSSRRVETVKTDAGYRLIALPHSLTRLILHVIDVFHTDPLTGDVDATARLIPAIRAAEGGPGGFRNALKAASLVVGGGVDEEDLVIPHDMRKGFATDLAWSLELEAIVMRRAMGHRAGQDVFALVYTLDDRLFEAMKPAACVIDAQIVRSIGSLLVPTTMKPRYDSSLDRRVRAGRDASLAEIGWQISALGDGWIDVEEAAAVLSMSPIATRRLLPDQITGVKCDRQWRVRLEDVVSYRERFEGWWRIEDLADQVGASYHQVHATIQRLELEPRTDEYSRQVLLTSEQADVVIDEYSRIEQLRLRSMPVAEVARMLNASHSSIHLWVKTERLVVDEETDASGKTYVTRASVQSELDRRGMKRLEVVSAAELKEYSGLDDVATRALVARSVLVRGPRGGYTTDSVEAWMMGYRPDLLASGLIHFE
ncbi:MAG: site-specific integrase [Acidobacteria bacterium]|nr:site-specific integrase [Acidobacteriota bacterium]